MNHHVKAAEALLDAGAAVNTPNSRGRMPLAYAIQVRDTQLSVRLLRLMQQQQQPAGDGQLPSMEPVIAAVAWLTIKPQHAHCLVRLFAAVMDAWGPSPAADLLQGLLKHLRGKPHNLAEAMLLGWRQAQTEQLHRTHVTLDRLQRLVLDPQAASRRQQQKQQCPLLRRRLEKQARALRLPLALLLTKMGHGQGRASGNAVERPSGASLAASMADLSLGHSSSSSNNSSNSSSSRANVITAAAQRGSLKEVATLLAPAAPAELPALLLTAAQAAGRAGHTYVCNAALQQFASLDWQAAACTHSSAPLGPLVRAAVAASAPATASTAAAPGGPVAATPTGTQQQRQQPQGSVSGVGFCLYRALLDSWQAVPEMVGKEFMAQVVEAVEATALAATAQAVEGA
jgi:ankyrin repeat protein